MQNRSDYTAPWSMSLKVITVLSEVLLLAIAGMGLFTGPQEDIYWIVSMVGLPLIIAVLPVFWLIGGYVLTKDALLIRRLGWESRVLLQGLESVEVDPEAMKRSWRTMGNGGMFCFAGYFRNKKLGSYRAWATDPRLSVVLRFPGRTLVVTPGDPEAFAAKCRELSGVK